MDQPVARTVLPVGLSDRLNAECFCMTLDRNMLLQHLKIGTGHEKMWSELQLTHPHLFAGTPAFVSEQDLLRMLATVQAVERISRLEAYRERVLSSAPEIARHDFGPLGVFMGMTFTLPPDGPQTHEINTNAGGAFSQCRPFACPTGLLPGDERSILLPIGEGFESAIAAIFKRVAASRKDDPARTIGI